VRLNRWTLEEGIAVDGVGDSNYSGAPSALGAATAASVAAGPSPAADGGRKAHEGGEEDATTPRASEASSSSSGAAAAARTGVSTPAGEDRWGMDDGASDLAEHGVELEMVRGGGGFYLPLPSSSASVLVDPRGGRGKQNRKRGRQQEWAEEARAEAEAEVSRADESRGSSRHYPFASFRLRRQRKTFFFLSCDTHPCLTSSYVGPTWRRCCTSWGRADSTLSRERRHVFVFLFASLAGASEAHGNTT